MELLQVDQAKCVKCGICGAVCPRCVIELRQGWPEAVAPAHCMRCGQCVAACPSAALDHVWAPLAGQAPQQAFPAMNKETAYQFLRSRRSIRKYEQKPVPRESLLALMDIARFAPSASNSQGISYVVVEDSAILQQISAATIDWMEACLQRGDAGAAKRFTSYVGSYRSTGKDVILRGAPGLVIAAADKGLANGRDNTHFALAYVELYAPTLGLGTCYAGLVELCARSGCPDLVRLLNLPEDQTITGAVMVGYPSYRYARLVDRNPLDIRFVSS